MKFVVASLIFAFSLSSLQAQSSSQQAIIDLKEGYLIVNLIVPQHKIDALIEKGKEQEASELTAETKVINDSVVDAFKSKYTFSKMLFIYSIDLKKFRNGDPSVLFDLNDSARTKMPEKYLFVEYGETPKRNINGLIVKDKNREIIKKDYFPYFISEYYGADSFEFMVNKLNKKFFEYHEYATD